MGLGGHDTDRFYYVEPDFHIDNPAWAIYPAEIIAPLTEKQRKCTFEGRDYKFDTLMGFYLPSVPSGNQAEARALCVSGLDYKSRLFGNSVLGCDSLRIIGVDKKYAEGLAKK